MPRTLVVDDDPLGRALLADLLDGLGHTVQPVSTALQAGEYLRDGAVDFVIVSASMPGGGVDLAEQVQRLTPAPGVVLVAVDDPGPVVASARARGVRCLGAVGRPVDPAKLVALLAPAASPVEELHGQAALEAARGPVERVSPMVLLHLAHRVGAGGALVIERGGEAARIVLRSGRVMHVEGVPGLLAQLTPPPTDHRHLAKDVGAAVASGHPIDRVLEAATAALAEWLARASQLRGGLVRFDALVVPPAGAFPLPATLPRLLAGGQRQARPIADVEREWAALAEARAHARPPDDSPEDRWGLDAAALRVIRLANRPRTVHDLLDAAGAGDPARRAEVLRALDFLQAIGLLLIDGGALGRDATVTSGRRPDATEEDPRVAALRAALASLEGAHPIDILQLGERKKLTEDEVSQAFRAVSKQYHPDAFFTASPLVRAMAEACFAKINQANEFFRAPGGMAEAHRFLQARAAGRGFVTEKDHQIARVAFKKAEVLFRNRDWRGADAGYAEAFRLDPHTWPHAFHAYRAGALSRRLTLDAATRLLDELPCPDVKAKAEVLVSIGNLQKLDGRHAEALRRYQQAAELDPGNHDAARELRLHQSRTEKSVSTASQPQTATERLTSFFRRASDKK